MIAELFDVTVDWILGDKLAWILGDKLATEIAEEQSTYDVDETQSNTQALYDQADLALRHMDRELSPQAVKEILEFIEFKKRQDRRE